MEIAGDSRSWASTNVSDSKFQAAKSDFQEELENLMLLINVVKNLGLQSSCLKGGISDGWLAWKRQTFNHMSFGPLKSLSATVTPIFW
jgi:hypothetical protein